MNKIFRLLLVFAPFGMAAQSGSEDCDTVLYNSMIKKALIFIENERFDKADLVFRSARVCQPNKAKFIDSMLVEVRWHIGKQKNKSSKIARGSLNVGIFMEALIENPTLGVRMMKYNAEKHPESKASLEMLRRTLSDTTIIFYSKMIELDSPVLCLAFSHDGRKAIIGQKNNVVSVWDIKSGMADRVYKLKEQIRAVSVWDIKSGMADRAYKLKEQIRAVSFSKDDKELLVVSGNELLACDTSGETLTRKIFGCWDREFSREPQGDLAKFSLNGEKLFIGGCLVDLGTDASGKWVEGISGHTINNIDFSPDGKKVLLLKRGYTHLSGFGSLVVNEEDAGEIICGAYSTYGTQLATALKSGFIISGQAEKTVDILPNYLEFSPDSSYILIGHKANLAELWFPEIGRTLQLLGHDKEVTSMRIAPDGNMVLTGSRDGTVRLWNETNVYNLNSDNYRLGKMEQMSRSFGLSNFTSKISTKKLTEQEIEYKLENVYNFSNLQLYRAGLQLEPEDLLTLWQQGEQLTEDELKLIQKTENK